MLSFIENLGYRSAAFAISGVPEQEQFQILSTLRHFYGDISQSALVPPAHEKALQSALAQASPTLTHIGEQLRDKLNTDYSAILISRIGIDHLDLDTRAALLFALSLSMGSPTPTDKVDRKVVWDIRALGCTMRAGHVPTFSEHPQEAVLHTDTQYYQTPERFMLLYCNQSAQCGGGFSTFRDIGCVKQALDKTEQGRWALEMLEHESLPFRVPMSFTKDAGQNTQEITYAPIFSDRPHVRYRRDTLEQGFKLKPELETPHVRQALDIFAAELERADMSISTMLQPDDLLVLNNHECLHGRTAFSDLNRHAFRIRINE